MGCGGGWYYWAWTYAATSPLMLTDDYPYTSGVDGHNGDCLYHVLDGKVVAEGQMKVAADTNSIKAAIAQQPVAAAVASDNYAFSHYVSGVITDPLLCPGKYIDHAVTLVGYGNDEVAGGYYIVRNSWGDKWGDHGYLKIGMLDDAYGICGINQYVAFVGTN